MKTDDLIAENLVAHENVSIDEALVKITDNHRGSLVVIDDEGVYRGVVSDGEIRRAMVKGATGLAPLAKIVNVNAMVLANEKRSEAARIFNEHPSIMLVPILGKGNKLVDVVVRNESVRKLDS